MSNIQGEHVVASMVVFEDGLARKGEYRRFTLRAVHGQDDVAWIREVIGRRLRRHPEERENSGLDLGVTRRPERAATTRFARRDVVGRMWHCANR